MHSCAPCAVCLSTCQHSFCACLSLRYKHLQLSQTLFRDLSGIFGPCSNALFQHKQAHCMLDCCFWLAAVSNLLAKQKGGGCINRQQADTSCNYQAALSKPWTQCNLCAWYAGLCMADWKCWQVLTCCSFGMLLYM